jgi:1A family penicillin-binding protein
MQKVKKFIHQNKAQIKHYSWQGFLGALEGLGVVLAALVIVTIALFFTSPSAELKNRTIFETSTIFDRTGEHVLYEIHGEFDRKIVGHGEISNSMRKAVIATEDANFYSHFGVDPQSIIRAIKVNYEKGGNFQGASTITQQLARSAFLNREKTMTRKVNEVILALKIEAKYSKEEILDFYLNEISFGANAYGVEAAAETFFGKNASDLTLGESALLSAVIKAPSYYSPYGNHRAELLSRQKAIIARMAELNLISIQERDEALKEDMLTRIVLFKQKIEAPHFVFYVKEQLERKYGAEGLETDGLKVTTTLDWEMQKKAEEIVREGALINAPRYRAENASMVVKDPRTGEILAMVGSRDYFDQKIDGQVNVSTRLRQPGSAFKPVIYASAFEKGYQPETMLYDVKTNFGPDGSGKDYIPRNYNGQFSGLVSMREALARSLNIPAVKTLYLVGIDEAITTAKKMGITTLTRRDKYGLSLALGGGEINLLELTSAFSVFATEGMKNETREIIKITKNGEEIFGPKDYMASQSVLDAQVARKINSVLSDNGARSAIFGSNSPLFIAGKNVAVKTGTTQDNRDGWTIGYSPNIAVGVWAGNNDNSPARMGADGVYVAAPMWNKFMRWVLEKYPNNPFTDYARVSSDKPMLAGKLEQKTFYYNNKSGKKISESKAKKTSSEKISVKSEPTAMNDILFYVNRVNPLGALSPDMSDPMVDRWNQGVAEYFGEKKESKK